MKEILLIGLQLFGLTMVLAAGGIAMIWMRKLKGRNFGRHVLLAALVVTSIGFWLTQRSTLAPGFSQIDYIVSMGFILVFTYIFLWVCIDRVLDSHRHSSDFQESSVLSMLYTNSMQSEIDFPPTDRLGPAPADVGGDVKS